MKLLILCIALAGSPIFTRSPSPKPTVDKVTCPPGYQLVDGTYRVVKGSGVPQKAYANNNTLVVESPTGSKIQAIAVCARIPL
jgi:hypothetical protein